MDAAGPSLVKSENPLVLNIAVESLVKLEDHPILNAVGPSLEKSENPLLLDVMRPSLVKLEDHPRLDVARPSPAKLEDHLVLELVGPSLLNPKDRSSRISRNRKDSVKMNVVVLARVALAWKGQCRKLVWFQDAAKFRVVEVEIADPQVNVPRFVEISRSILSPPSRYTPWELFSFTETAKGPCVG